MSILPIEYLRHISDEIHYLMQQSQGMTSAEFIKDETAKRAFVRCLEIIGEAAKKLPNDFKAEYPHIDWRSMAGMRDRLIHDYFGVDYDIVWDVVIHKIPMLQKEVLEIIDKESE